LYVPPAFAIDDDAAFDLVELVGTGHLVTVGPAGLASSFVPLLVDRPRRTLRGHLARANPHVAAIGADVDALVIVTGADGYVSPSWYPTKREHGKVVPTWNYELVHVHGSVRVIDDADTVLDIVRSLTDLHEGDREEPWSIDDAPADYVAATVRRIVGIEITVESIVGKRKLSQNRSATDIAGVRAGQSADVGARSGGAPMTAALDRANPAIG
jgi:transcriptional regulator